MRYAVYLPLLLSVVLAPPLVTAWVRRLPDRLDPRTVVRLLVAVLAGLAVASTVSLALLAMGGVAYLRHGAVPTAGGHADPGGLLAGSMAALLLLVAVARSGWICRRTARRRRLMRRQWVDGREGPWVVDDDAVYALAAPPVRGGAGRVVLSRGLLSALDDAEQDAVVAHEREHLEGRHHRVLVLGAFAAALNPGLGPLRRDLGYALERCADEAAAQRVDDRAVVARAIGRAALAARQHPGSTRFVERSLGVDAALMLGATSGPVPRRVAALLDTDADAPSSARIGSRPTAVRRGIGGPVLIAGTVALVTGLALAGAAHAALDLADILGIR